ncbi:crotonyl-CoA carboxylase/reductase [Paraburkholderia edwinii]|jgi:crotonyl-CoA carboxylase/reductase|uniref:Crotonyl-CoA carboxylase/reductase n=1 Tax=Paraburkholderia edwinii TaxID=2861782 RepID=A0ABX8UWN8_9BURK|nr:crotonyl-CoA carboxylase/reductase [Paraburkholderia edwinii]QYD73423.1 crotonyl-CoA carboxylase/reductase [Paraburkholderia edwinii]
MDTELLDIVVETRNNRPELFEIGQPIPLGVVPRKMHAWTIRRENHGEPQTAFTREIVDVPSIGANEVLVHVMAAGVNYNGVWAALGQPFSVLDLHDDPYHITGSDAAGVVWAVGSNVRAWKVGDEVIAHCSQVDGEDEECNGGDPMLSSAQRIWGYETTYGSFAQFSRVQATQLMPRPKHLTWSASACYTLTLATAYRMLFGHKPHALGPGQSVLIWGAAGGLGTMAIQLAALAGARPVAVVSDDSKAEFVRSLGAVGVINRSQFSCWGAPPAIDSTAEYSAYIDGVKKFGKAIWQALGEKRDVDMVFEHPGRNTFAASCYVVKRGGMVVFCAATSGYDLTCDARYIWMRQKRIQGSHFASLKEAAQANRLVMSGRIDPCLSEVFPWSRLPEAHAKIRNNLHLPGNMAVLVQASSSDDLDAARRA